MGALDSVMQNDMTAAPRGFGPGFLTSAFGSVIQNMESATAHSGDALLGTSSLRLSEEMKHRLRKVRQVSGISTRDHSNKANEFPWNRDPDVPEHLVPEADPARPLVLAKRTIQEHQQQDMKDEHAAEESTLIQDANATTTSMSLKQQPAVTSISTDESQLNNQEQTDTVTAPSNGGSSVKNAGAADSLQKLFAERMETFFFGDRITLIPFVILVFVFVLVMFVTTIGSCWERQWMEASATPVLKSRKVSGRAEFQALLASHTASPTNKKVLPMDI